MIISDHSNFEGVYYRSGSINFALVFYRFTFFNLHKLCDNSKAGFVLFGIKIKTLLSLISYKFVAGGYSIC